MVVLSVTIVKCFVRSEVALEGLVYFCESALVGVIFGGMVLVWCYL